MSKKSLHNRLMLVMAVPLLFTACLKSKLSEQGKSLLSAGSSSSNVSISSSRVSLVGNLDFVEAKLTDGSSFYPSHPSQLDFLQLGHDVVGSLGYVGAVPTSLRLSFSNLVLKRGENDVICVVAPGSVPVEVDFKSYKTSGAVKYQFVLNDEAGVGVTMTGKNTCMLSYLKYAAVGVPN